jgi:dTDP-4-dehydrorhamnose 3,5-epimerase
MIDGVSVRPLCQIIDDRGKVMHMLRRDDRHFSEFGEIYFSVVHPKVIKGWHLHKRMTINYAVVQGLIKLVLYDPRAESRTHREVMELYVGPENYCLVTVPPGVWNGFQGVGLQDAIVANCATIPHDPDEIVRLDPFDPGIPYDWTFRHR